MEIVGDFEYNTKDLIGHGAFAVVFKGRHRKNVSYVVAIKSITKKNLAKSQNLLGKEIKILKELTELHHENVVALLDCKETPHNVYLVMEYCNGGDLADYLNAKGTLSEDTIRLFLRQLAGAMKALHAKGIVHRDLKPQNILLSHCGKPCPQPQEITLKIADFGFARFLQDGVMAATLCGSPMYMAPEVIMSLQYDAKADLWSLGTIVFQCLTGKAPFQAQTPQALKQFYEKNANLAPKIPSGTSPELAELLLGLLRRNAKDRMEFDAFFSHPFLKKSAPKSTSPVPVPNRQMSVCSEPSPGACPISSSPGSNKVPSPLPGHLPPSPGPLFPEPARMSDERMSDVPQGSNSAAGSPVSAKEQESASSPDEHDDFVLVPANIPSDQSCDSNCSDRHRHAEYNEPLQGVKIGAIPTPLPHQKLSAQGPHLASPPRPSFLPISEQAMYQSSNQASSRLASEPIPVPTQKDVYNQIHGSFCSDYSRGARDNNNEVLAMAVPSGGGSPHHRNPSPSSSPHSPSKSAVPRSEPISMKRTLSCDRAGPDISSLSPPAVQFMMGTPPSNGRRRSASGSSCGTPPPVTTWQVSPVSQCGFSARHTPNSSPLRRSGTTSPHLGGPLFAGGTNILPPILGSPTRLTTGMDVDNATNVNSDRCGNITDLCQPPLMPFGTRAVTLPEITEAAAVQRRPSLGFFTDTVNESLPFGTSPPGMEGPIMFVAPELPEETLLEREHNETLAKLNFVLALVDCVVELAKSRGTPLSALTESVNRVDAQPAEGCRRAEQLVLLVRALQLLSSGLNLATQELRSGQLQPSSTVKNVVSVLNEKFHYCLTTCKQLNSPGLLQKAGVDPGTTNITADKILYNYAIEMCQSAALDELFGNPQECFQRYQTAQILLHSLSQQVHHDQDKALLLKYKDAVEKRLYVLQQQGYIYAYDTT